jgi:hypothetical protein
MEQQQLEQLAAEAVGEPQHRQLALMGHKTPAMVVAARLAQPEVLAVVLAVRES